MAALLSSSIMDARSRCKFFFLENASFVAKYMEIKGKILVFFSSNLVEIASQ